MKAGDFAVNMRTGELRLVVEVAPTAGEVTFSRDPKWYAAKDWRANVSLVTPRAIPQTKGK